MQWQQRLEAVEEGKQAKAQRRESNLLSRQGKGGGAPAADGEKGKDKGKSHASGGVDSSSSSSRKKPRTEATKQPKAAESAAAAQRRPGFEGRFKTGEFLNQRKGGPA